MKIKKFSKIKARIFKDFNWPQDLPEFADYNLIYGWNASGKTTLADILRMVEKRQFSDSEGIDGFSITISGDNRITITDDNVATLPQCPNVRVFNHTFIKENVFTQNGALPIFFLGEENIEKQKDFEQKKEDLERLKNSEIDKKKEKDRKIKEQDSFLQTKASEVRGWLNITNQKLYTKEHFKANCVNLSSARNEQKYLKDPEQLDILKKKISSIHLDKISPILLNILYFDLLYKEVKRLMEKTVISLAIEALARNPKISNWVKDGLHIHKEYKSEKCEFCLQKLPETRMKELEGHFNNQFNALEAELNEKIKAISQKISDLGSFQLPDPAKLYSDLVPKYQVALQNFSELKFSWVEFLNVLKMALEDKKNNPFREVQLDIIVPSCETSQLNAINSIINEHNERTENLNQVINHSKEAIKQHVAAESLPKYRELNSAIKSLEEEYSALLQTIHATNQKINSLEQEIIKHRKPAEDINNDLQDYLGHSELRFIIDEKTPGYIIMRGGKRAHALSEGEKSAIALLYFLKSLEDSNFKLKDGIVVIDDPVSSMDDTSLFYAFGYIQNRTKEAKQLFILTHNFSFFIQVKNWFYYKNYNTYEVKEKNKSRFFQTICTIENGERLSQIQEMDGLLTKYGSEYHYLFSIVYQKANAPSGGSLDQYYHMPNIARRFLEAFLAFRFPGTTGEFRKSLEESQYNSSKKKGILRFLHTHSHKNQIGVPDHDSTILSHTSQILFDILDLIKFEDEKHYKEMIKLVKSYQTPILRNQQ
jgi:wobble nucleotide-excising tRNase